MMLTASGSASRGSVAPPRNLAPPGRSSWPKRGEAPATPGAVAQALHFSQATITTIVDRLVALNYVQRQRSERDKRQFHLSILPDGVKALDDAPDPLQMTFTDRFGRLQAWEQAMILASVERLALLMDAQNIM